MKIELLNQLDQIESTLKAFAPVVKAFIQDETQSLEDRWEVFCKIPSSMPSFKDYVYGYYKFGGEEIVWYDDHNIDRYETADNVRIIEKYEEELTSDYKWMRHSVTQEKIDDLKRQMLKSGFRYWINDW